MCSLPARKAARVPGSYRLGERTSRLSGADGLAREPQQSGSVVQGDQSVPSADISTAV